MQKLKNLHLHTIVSLLFLIILGCLQNASGKEISSTKDNLESDQKAIEFLRKLLQRARLRHVTPKYNTVSDTDLRHIVSKRFMKEMAILFFSLPELNQCNIIVAVSQTAQCKLSNIGEFLFNLTEVKHNVMVTCPVDDSALKYQMSCIDTNKTLVVNSIRNELLKVFGKLPDPFKCHVVNTVALIYNLKGRRHLANRFSNLKLTIRDAGDTVKKIYPSISIPETCVDAEVGAVPSVPPVNITVSLGNYNKTSWLETLKRKGPKILRAVYEYEGEKRKILGQGSTPQYLQEKKELIDSAQFVLVTVNGTKDPFSVLFRLKVKRKQSNQLREMKSTYRIVQALSAKTQEDLRAIFNASIVTVGLSKEQSKLNITPRKENKWNLNRISKAMDLFPGHLSEYHKQLAKPSRCFIILYISKKMKESPRTMEMLYNSYNHLSRKHCCYYTERAVSTNTPIIIPITEEIFRITPGRVSTVTHTARVTNIPKRNDPATKGIISEKMASEDSSSALEIALFSLLGFLCATILVFTIYWVLVALKSKAKYQLSNSMPNGTVETQASVLKVTTVPSTGSSGLDCVHFINGNQRNIRRFQGSGSFPTENKLSKLYSAPQAHGLRCEDKRTFPECSQDIGGNTTSRNTRACVENKYYSIHYPLQQQRNGIAALESPWIKRLPYINSGCHRSRKEVLDHSVWDRERVLESQGKVISYCSTSDSNSNVQPHRTITYTLDCLSSEKAHKTVLVMLECKEMKENQV